MREYRFTMDYAGTVVAKGVASAAMVYEFQKTFIESIGPGGRTVSGGFVRLDELLDIVAGSFLSWVMMDATNTRFAFRVES